MSRLVLDSINFDALAATRWPHLIGYVNGRISKWSPEHIKRTRAAGQLLGLVDVLGTAPREASILDFERGDVQSPAVVREWARARNQFANDATVYCSPRSIPTVVSGLRGEPCYLWVVDLTSDGEPPFTVPHYPGLPSNVKVIARQFVFGPRSGGNYDMSIWYRDEWHPEQLAPAHLFAARAAAVTELGPYQNASSAAELTDPHTGQITAAPLHVVTLPEPFGATLPCAWCPGPVTCASAGRCLEPDGGEPAAAPVDQAAAAVDQAATELAGAALVASTAPSSPVPAADVDQAAAFAAAAAPVPVIHDDRMNAALAQVKRLSELSDEELIAEHLAAASSSTGAGPGTAGSVATAAAVGEPGPAQPPLNHDFIRGVLVDVGEVAKQLRGGGWVHAAHALERGAAIAWELGSALKSAGL